MKDSCKDCKERYIGCHSSCQSYKNYKEDIKKKAVMILGDEYDKYIKAKRASKNNIKTSSGSITYGKAARTLNL